MPAIVATRATPWCSATVKLSRSCRSCRSCCSCRWTKFQRRKHQQRSHRTCHHSRRLCCSCGWKIYSTNTRTIIWKPGFTSEYCQTILRFSHKKYHILINSNCYLLAIRFHVSLSISRLFLVFLPLVLDTLVWRIAPWILFLTTSNIYQSNAYS